MRHEAQKKSTTVASLKKALNVVLASSMILFSSVAAKASELESVGFVPGATKVEAFKIDDSVKPVVFAWKAPNPKAIMVAIHGFGLHKNSFENFAIAMQERGTSTYSMDVRGFGGWAEEKKNDLNFSKTFNDLTLLLTTIHAENPGVPVFLVGESMGGAIALKYAAEKTELVDGVISSVPANERFEKFRLATKVWLSYLMGGGRDVNLNHLLVDRVFEDKLMKQGWQTDADAKLTFKLGELIRLVEFMRDAEHSAARIDALPVLIVQGKLDRLVKPQGTEKIFQKLRTSDKQLLELENGEHLTFEDGQFDYSLLAQVDRWIDSHNKATLISRAE